MGSGKGDGGLWIIFRNINGGAIGAQKNRLMTVGSKPHAPP